MDRLCLHCGSLMYPLFTSYACPEGCDRHLRPGDVKVAWLTPREASRKNWLRAWYYRFDNYPTKESLGPYNQDKELWAVKQESSFEVRHGGSRIVFTGEVLPIVRLAK